jgi:predicted transcriptional regulator
MNEQQWNDILRTAQCVKNGLGPEFGVIVADHHKVLYYEPGINLNHGLTVGSNYKLGSITDRVIKSGQRVVDKVGAELYGVPYIGMGSPLRDDQGHIIGCLAVFQPTTTQEIVLENSKRLAEASTIISETTDGLSASSQQLAATATNLAGQADNINENVQQTDIVLKLIKDVAAQTHLLGLNAAIEAARAGDAGRGFNVVAEEIRKLAARSNNSVKEIAEILTTVRNAVNDLTDQTHQIAAVSEEQSASIEEINASISEISTMSDQLKELADQLIK